MKSLLLKILSLGVLFMAIISCKNNESPELKEEFKSIYFEADFQSDSNDIPVNEVVNSSSVRTLKYDYEENSGKDYPKPVLKFSDGETGPLVLILQQKTNPNTRIITKSNFVFRANGKSFKAPVDSNSKLYSASKGKFFIRGNINIPSNIVLNTTQKDWKVLAILGGDLVKEGGKNYIRFASINTDIINYKDANSSNIRSLESIYMNEEWNDVTVTLDESGNPAMYVNSPIYLINQGVVFMLRAKNSYDKNIPLRGFRIASENIAFNGLYNLSDMNFGEKPLFVSNNQNDGHRFYIRPQNEKGVKQKQVLSAGELSNFFVVVGIPTVETKMKVDPKDSDRKIPKEFNTSVQISSLLGNKYEVEGIVHNYNNKSISHNSFISIKTVELKKRELVHPIEAFMVDEEDGVIFRIEEKHYFKAVANANNAAINKLGEAGRSFNLPSESHLRILFPDMRGGTLATNGGVGSTPILNMAQNGNSEKYSVTDWDTSTDYNYTLPSGNFLPESVNIWGRISDFNSEYKMKINSPNSPAYGLRFKESTKYRSAYRYQVVEKNGKKMMEIRVRLLTLPKYKKYNINNISSEKWWNTPVEWNEREIVRYVPKGRYWSNTKYERAFTPKGAVSVAKVLLDQSDDQQTAYPYGAFVTDSKRRIWMENPDVEANWVNSGFALVTNSPSSAQ